LAQSPDIVRTVKNLRKQVAKWRSGGKTVALVPTMGALHDGHVSLVKLAARKADRVVVSIFVNPTQFSAHEDLSRYPRDEAGDVAKLQSTGAVLVWAPSATEMYPEGFSTRIAPGGSAMGLEADVRPGHFAGVATVCCKLFSQVVPNIAIFGEKDYQQLIVLKQMVADLNLPLKIVGAPTKRDADGLALSSRNAYLTPAQRAVAPALHRTLTALASDIAQGADIPAAVRSARRKLLSAGFDKVDYVEVRDATTLSDAVDSNKPLRALRTAAGMSAPCAMSDARAVSVL
jgi:pantoate--beta-alanine ligase